jgi:hypothetical protein
MEAGCAVSIVFTNYDFIARGLIRVLLTGFEAEMQRGRGRSLCVGMLRASTSCVLLGVAFGMFINPMHIDATNWQRDPHKFVSRGLVKGTPNI